MTSDSESDESDDGEEIGKPGNGPQKERQGGERAKILPPSLVSALEGAGVDPRDPSVTKALAISLSVMTASASLPLPPPSVMMDYEKALPGLNAKLVEWTERQSQHRQSLERETTHGSERRMNLSQIFTATIALVALVLSAYEGQYGNPYVASVIAIVGIGGPAAAVYLARSGRLSGNKLPSAAKSPSIPKAPQTQGTSNKPKRKR
jgi:uncharacterized membrane protein